MFIKKTNVPSHVAAEFITPTTFYNRAAGVPETEGGAFSGPGLDSLVTSLITDCPSRPLSLRKDA